MQPTAEYIQFFFFTYDDNIDRIPKHAHVDQFSKQLAPQKSVTLKRRVGYVEEELGTTRARLARMEIDSGELVVETGSVAASSTSHCD